MATTIEVSIDDLTDEGLRHFVEVAVGSPVADLSDWKFTGLLIEQFKIELSYFPPKPNDARTILGRDTEDWYASLTTPLGDRDAYGRSPQIAISKLVAATQGNGDGVVIPVDQIEKFVLEPDDYRK